MNRHLEIDEIINGFIVKKSKGCEFTKEFCATWQEAILVGTKFLKGDTKQTNTQYDGSWTWGT